MNERRRRHNNACLHEWGLLAAIIAAASCCQVCSAQASQAAVSDQLGMELHAFEAMVQTDPKNISLHYTVGMLYQLAGAPQKVCDHLYAAYMLAPEHTDPQLLFHLANNLKAIGENEAAVNFYALAIGKAPEGSVNWVLASISLDYIGRPHEAVRGFQTVLRLGPTPRIESWVEIYMLSALVKIGHIRRALYRYQQLVGPLTPHLPRASSAVQAGRGNIKYDDWNANVAALHTGSGWLRDPLTQRAMRLNMHTGALESHASFFHATVAHRRNFQRLRDSRALSESSRRSRAHAQGQEEDGEEDGGKWVDADEEWVAETLRALQYGGGCEHARALVVELGRRDGKTGKIGNEIHGFGFGAQMHVLTVALAYAVRTQRVLVLRSQDNWWYTDRNDCPSRSFTCYFEAVGGCSEEEVTRGLSRSRRELDADGEIRKLSAETEEMRVVYTDVRLDNFLNQRANRLYVPEPLRHRGLLWWRAQLVQYLLRPNDYIQGLLGRELQALAWHTHEQHIVGVHVRHGDKKTESAVVPMEQYLDAALQIARGRRHEPYHNARQFIYISTDDPEALAAARAWEGLPQHADSVTVVAREGEVRGVSTATDMVVQMHNVNVTRYGEEAVLNLLLLAHCRAFVGTFSSNFGRLAYELAFARRQTDLFAASMDVFWHAYP